VRTLKRRAKGLDADSFKPVARSDELAVEEVDDDLLIYDSSSGTAHSLSATAARVWRRCDGTTDIGGLSAELGLDRETVTRAVAELEESGLLETPPVVGVTRRQASVKLAKLGAVAASAPLVYSIAAPTPALAQTQNFCESLGCQTGCGACHQAGCACCGPGGGETKLCTQDCSDTFCNPPEFSGHCGTPVTSVSCNGVP
jgi:hypothetical protein